MRETYATDVIREKIVGPPFLLGGETLELDAKHGFPPTMAVVSAILTFIPPFLLGPALFFVMWFQKKHNGVWITNMRLVDFQKVLFSKKYMVTSIPLAEISKIRHARGGGFTALIDRLFGVGDLQIYVKDSRWVQCSISDIKSPGKMIQHIQKAANVES